MGREQNQILEDTAAAERDENLQATKTAHELEMLILLQGKLERDQVSVVPEGVSQCDISFDNSFERDQEVQNDLEFQFSDVCSTIHTKSPVVQNCQKKLKEFRLNLQKDAEYERQKLRSSLAKERTIFFKDLEDEIEE